MAWWRQKTLWWAFIKRDICERLAGSFLGPVMLFLQPLAQILVFVFLFKYIFNIRIRLAEGINEDFLRFFLTGFIPWSIHNEALIRGANSILAQGHLITKVVFPVEILPFSTVAAAYLVGLPGLIALWLILYFTGGLPVQAFLGLAWLFVQFLFTLGITFFLAALFVYLRDLLQFLGLLVMIWFYCTPILYSQNMLPEKIRFLLVLNPFTYFVNIWQTLCLGTPFKWIDLVLAIISSFLSLALGLKFFQKSKEGFADIL